MGYLAPDPSSVSSKQVRVYVDSTGSKYFNNQFRLFFRSSAVNSTSAGFIITSGIGPETFFLTLGLFKLPLVFFSFEDVSVTTDFPLFLELFAR